MPTLMKIGLLGLTGAGKTTLAKYLETHHGFQICSTGKMCREVSNLIFGNEDKGNLFLVTDALQTIDPSIFLKAALRRVDMGRAIVIDAVRYRSDWIFAKQQTFHLIRVTAAEDLRRLWLTRRGQSFDFEKDAHHASEVQLAEVLVDSTLDNSDTIKDLTDRLDRLLV